MTSPPPVLTELRLTESMKHAIDDAFEARRPMVISYVDENNAPQLSYRGSTQSHGDRRLAIWVRNPQGRILESIAKNPAVAMLYGYFEPDERGFMIFRGRARIETGESERTRIYEKAHEFERLQDPDCAGTAIVIDLDSVDGFFGGAKLAMRR
jgi:general stress protein 26